MRPPTTEEQQQLAAELGWRLYGFQPSEVVPLQGGGNTFRIELGGLPAKVIRLPGRVASVLREQRVVRAIRRLRRGPAVPALEFTQADLRDPELAAFSVFRHEPGIALRDFLLHMEPSVGEAMQQAGAAAALVAGLPASLVSRPRRQVDAIRSRRMAGQIQPVIEACGLQRLRPDLEQATADVGEPSSTLIHGAFGLPSLLAQPAAGAVGICVSDWGAARAGHRLWDLSTLLASIADLRTPDQGERAYLRRRVLDGFLALFAQEIDTQSSIRRLEMLAIVDVAACRLCAGDLKAAHRLAQSAMDLADA